MLLLPEFTQRRRLQEKYRRVRLRDLDFYLIDKRKNFNTKMTYLMHPEKQIILI